MIIGYVNSSLTKEQKDLIKKISEVLIDSNTLSIEENLLEFMKPTDQLLVYDFFSLNLSISQYGRILEYFKKKDLDLTFINVTDYERELLTKLVKHERSVIKKRVNSGIIQARKEGRIGGRPTINEEMKNKIIKYRIENKMTIREIALLLDISVGTVHKYLKLVN